MRYHVRFYNDVILVPCPVGPCPIISCHAVSSAQHTSPHHINLKSKVANQIGICGNIASLKVRLLTPCTRLWEGAKSLKRQTKICNFQKFMRQVRTLSVLPGLPSLQPFSPSPFGYDLKFRMTSWVPDVRGRRVAGPPGWVDVANHKHQDWPKKTNLTRMASLSEVPTKRWTMIRNNERVMKENESRTFTLAQTLQLHCRITQYHTIFLMLPGQIALKGPHLAKTSSKSLWSLLLRRKHTRNCGVWQSTTTAESKLVSTHSRTLQTPRDIISIVSMQQSATWPYGICFHATWRTGLKQMHWAGFGTKGGCLPFIALCRGMP